MGRPLNTAMALKLGANQYTGLAYSAKACSMVACNMTTKVNIGTQAGQANECSTYLDVYAFYQMLSAQMTWHTCGQSKFS